jgi:hypothetical protein
MIDEYSYVIVDNGAANTGELAIGRVQGRRRASGGPLARAERHECPDTNAGVAAHVGGRRWNAAHQRPAATRQDGRDLRGQPETWTSFCSIHFLRVARVGRALP